MGKSCRAKDISGQKFGKLTAIEFVGVDANRNAQWRFKCDCGREIVASGSRVRNGHTKSCGCLQKERASEIIQNYNKGPSYKQPTRYTHGGSKTRLYDIWVHMKLRCDNSNRDNYKYYGGRGIKVCKEWREDFSSFRDWALSHGYKDGLTIDRIDSNGNYEPDNCRWATVKEQQNNKRNNRMITIDGKTKTMAQWANEKGINYKSLANRIYHGMSVNEAVDPVCNNKQEGKS